MVQDKNAHSEGRVLPGKRENMWAGAPGRIIINPGGNMEQSVVENIATQSNPSVAMDSGSRCGLYFGIHCTGIGQRFICEFYARILLHTLEILRMDQKLIQNLNDVVLVVM